MKLKRFGVALLAVWLLAFTCTSQQIALITEIITIAEQLLPLILHNPAQFANVIEYTGQVLPIMDSVLANPTAINCASNSAKLASIAIPVLDRHASAQTQQVWADFVGSLQSFIAKWPPTPATASVSAQQPKFSRREIRKLDELRGRILALETSIQEAK